MRKKEVMELLRKHRKDIEKYGVKRIGLFGSVVRDEANEKSDVDVVVEFYKGRGEMKDFVGLIEFLEKLFNRKVDVLTPAGIKGIRIKSVRERIKKEVEYV